MFTRSPSRLSVALSLLILASLACNIFGPAPSPTPAITPTPAPSPTPLPPAPPNVIDYDPVRGDELPTDQPITIYFDAPMNRQTVEAAFTIEPAIAGAFAWQDDRTLVFQPSTPLERAAQYLITVGENAKSAAGLALKNAVSFKANTVGFLEVAQAIPAPATFDVDVNASITLLFNRPVVALTSLSDQVALPTPLTLDPPVSGVGEWLNTSIYVFHPDKPLEGGITYTGRVTAGLEDTTGGLLQTDFEWQFTTLAPNIVSIDPGFDTALNGLTRPITITFNQAMDKPSTEAALAVLLPSGNAAGKIEWSSDDTVLTFLPTAPYPYDTDVVVTIDLSARAAGGQSTLPYAFSSVFSTVDRPAILSTWPANGDLSAESRSGFRINFNAPMDVSTLDPRISLVPAPTQVYTYWGDYDTSYYLGWDLQPSTEYVVTLAPGMSDPYGTTIDAGQEIRFTTAPLDPEAYFNSGGGLSTFNRASEPVLYITTLNVPDVQLSLYRVSLNQFAAFSGPLSYDAYQNYAPAPEDLVREWTEDIADTLNERLLTRLSLLGSAEGRLEPGAYYLAMRVPGLKYRPSQLFLVSGVNLTLKAGLDETLVWATDLNTGQPLANLPITFYSAYFDVLTQGVTDAEGVLQLDTLSREDLWSTVYAVAGAPAENNFAITLSDWSSGIEGWDFNLPTQYYRSPYTVYVYTDRPLYRPGQVVYFKGVVREENDARFRQPDFSEVLVRIFNSNGDELFNANLPLNAFGTFAGEFQLGAEAALGYYSIAVGRDADVSLGGISFSVAQYRKPEFQVSVASPVTQVVQGATIPVTVDASFFFGGPVSNAAVHWSVLSADYYFNYPGPGYYDFTDFDYSNGGAGEPVYGVYGRLISESEGQTNGQGRATLNVAADLSDAKQSQLFTIEATVTDINGQQVSGRVEVLVHQGQFYIGVRPTQYIGQAGQPVSFEVLTLDWNGDPAPNQTLTADFNDHQWNCALEEDPEGGGNVWTCEAQDTLIESRSITTGANGKATVDFIPPAGGVYQLKVSGTDGGGHRVAASTTVWVASGEFITWRQENNDRLALVADRKQYRPGDTAEILIPSPYQGEATALVTVERGHILQHMVMRLTNNSTLLKLPITADYAPDVFVSVTLIKGVDENNPVPAFKVGLVKLSVSTEQQQLTVTLTPDKAKVGPRDTVTYALRATDYLGQPVQAEFSLSLVDLAVLSLTPPNSGPILDAFYSERGLGIRTSLGLTLAIDRYNIVADRAKGGGGGGLEEGFNDVRSRFLDTAYWKADVTTDANGEAKVSITLPDNLTTWRLDARGLTAETLVGQSTVDIVATKDLLIRPNTPRFFVVGDKAQLGAVVNNNTDNDLQVNVTLAGTGITLQSAASQSVSVKAHDRVEVLWDVTADDAEYADLTFTVEGGGLKDASKPTLGIPPEQRLPIYKYSAPETVGTAGQLDTATSILETVSLPRRFDATQGELQIQLDPSLAASMTGGLDYLEHFPYECTEQTVSRFLPNVLTYRALKDLGLSDPALENKLEGLVNTALQRLDAQQHVDGGWGWWASDQSDPYITAYVAFGLLAARDAGFGVSASRLANALSYLSTQLARERAVREHETWQLNRQAFILYVLAQADEPNTSATVNLYEARARLDTYARAYLALTLAKIDPADARVATLLSDFNNAAILSATGAHWEESTPDWWNMNTDTRSTAIVLEALVKLDPQNNLIPNVVRWLMVARKAQAWETTQETVWALIGLTDWMTVSGELKGNYDYNLTLNGQQLTSGSVNAANVREPVQLRIAIADLLRDQANQLLFNRGAGDGRLYYTAHLNIYLPVEDVRALGRGVIVSRQYILPGDDCGGAQQAACPIVTGAQAGQDITVKLTVIAPNDLYYVVIEDPIPAGAEPVDTSLLTTSIVGQPPALNPVDPLYYGWGWWWFSRSELRDEKVVLFANYLPKGTYEYTYTLHALLPGEYQVIPTYAREFYFPEVFGRGDGMVFTITP